MFNKSLWDQVDRLHESKLGSEPIWICYWSLEEEEFIAREIFQTKNKCIYGEWPHPTRYGSNPYITERAIKMCQRSLEKGMMSFDGRKMKRLAKKLNRTIQIVLKRER